MFSRKWRNFIGDTAPFGEWCLLSYLGKVSAVREGPSEFVHLERSLRSSYFLRWLAGTLLSHMLQSGSFATGNDRVTLHLASFKVSFPIIRASTRALLHLRAYIPALKSILNDFLRVLFGQL